MLKDYELDYKSDELENDGEVMLKVSRKKLKYYIIFEIKFNKLSVFCQTIQGRRGYEFYRLLLLLLLLLMMIQ
jgi:hypothetical protein